MGKTEVTDYCYRGMVLVFRMLRSLTQAVSVEITAANFIIES